MPIFKRSSPRGRPVCSLAAIGLWMAGAAQAATLQVNPSGSDFGNCQATACQTIGYALGQAGASGDTLQVAAGTYTEQLTINKSVAVVGAGSSATLIQAPAALATNPAVPGGSAGQKTAIVFVTGASTTAQMRDLQVRGPGSSACGSLGYGVFVGGNATFTLDGARLTAIRDNPLAGCQNGTAVRFGAPNPSQVGSGAVLNSVIDDFQKNGITVSNTGSNVTVRGNIVTGTLPAPVIAQNGIQVSSGAVAVVQSNTVSNLQCSPSNPNCGPNGSWSIGILLVDAGSGTQVSGNQIRNADAGLYAFGSMTSAPTIPLSANEIASSVYANLVAEGATLDMTDNTLTGAPVGLLASGDGGGPTTVHLSGGNVITGATTAGIGTKAGDPNQAITVSGQHNQFTHNAIGANNLPAAAATFQLPCNWWGTETGPANPANPLGTGNAASADVTYTNWSIDNTRFLCVGNPQRNEAIAHPPAPVPADAPWALVAAALALAGLGARRFRG